jgi:hypothetical protein
MEKHAALFALMVLSEEHNHDVFTALADARSNGLATAALRERLASREEDVDLSLRSLLQSGLVRAGAGDTLVADLDVYDALVAFLDFMPRRAS